MDSQSLEPPVSLEPPLPTPSSGPNKNLIIGSIALVFLLLAGVALAYFYYPPSPEKLSARLTQKLSETTSVEFSSKTELEMNPIIEGFSDSNQKINMTVEFDGASDSSGLNNPKLYGLIKMTGEGLVISADLRLIGKVVYFKLNEAPFLGFFDTGKIKNQWIKIDTVELNKELGLEEKNYSELTEDQKKLISELFKHSKMIKLADRVKSERANGVMTNHFKFIIDKQEFKTFVIRVSEITNKELTAEDKSELEKIFLDQLNFQDGEIWVGRKDALPYRITLPIEFRNQEGQLAGKMLLNLNFKNYNQPVVIEAPSTSKNFNEILGDPFGEMGVPQDLPPIPTN